MVCFQTTALPYAYEKVEKDGHVIHTVTLDPAQYTFGLVKANDGTDGKGRETVSSMAQRVGAELAINGGFFEISSDREMDGKPSGTLVVQGNNYQIQKKAEGLLLIHGGKPSITFVNPSKTPLLAESMVSGIPLLLWEGEMPRGLAGKTGDFYAHPHGRTAVGIKADGTVVWVVAEHGYGRDLAALTLGEVQGLMKAKGGNLAQAYGHANPGQITLDELKEILKKEFEGPAAPKGLTIPELAQFMKSLGCREALNLDGGGSSTLWMEGAVVNKTVGDADEGQGVSRERPVSDAIIVKRR